MKLTKKAAYEIAKKLRPDVLPTTTRDLPQYDVQLAKKLETCWVFELPDNPDIIGTTPLLAVDWITGKVFEFGYGI